MGNVSGGRTVQRLLDERGLINADMCRGTGFSHAYVSRMISGQQKQPSLENSKKIAEYFGMSLDEFWSEVLKDSTNA